MFQFMGSQQQLAASQQQFAMQLYQDTSHSEQAEAMSTDEDDHDSGSESEIDDEE